MSTIKKIPKWNQQDLHDIADPRGKGRVIVVLLSVKSAQDKCDGDDEVGGTGRSLAASFTTIPTLTPIIHSAEALDSP